MNTINLLLLEDDAGDRELIKNSLNRLDVTFSITEVINREQYISAIQEEKFDAILSDNSMPQFSGSAALKIAKKTDSTVPFILITGSISEEYAVEILKEGAADYLLKDRLQRLPTAILAAIDKSRLETDRQKNLDALIESEERYRNLFENSPFPQWIIDGASYRFLDVNKAAVSFYGYSREEFLKMTALDIRPDEEKEKFLKNRPVATPGFINRGVWKHAKKDGSIAEVEVHADAMMYNGQRSHMVIVTDVTARREAERKLQNANRMHIFTSQINQAIVHIPDPQELFWEACRIAVEVGKFEIASIDSFDPAEKKLTSVAQNNIPREDLELFKTLEYSENGAIAKMLATGEHYVINDYSQETEQGFWSQYAFRRNFRSAILLPIKQMGKIKFIFSIFSKSAHTFNQSEISLLNEAAGDISFALDVFEKEKLRQQAEAKLKHSEQRLRQAQQIAHFGNWEMLFAAGVAEWSEEALRIYGLPVTAREQTYDSWISFIHPDDLDFVLGMIKKGQETLTNSAFYHRILRKDGSVRHIYSQTNFEFDEQGQPIGLYGVAHDITEMKEAEQALVQSEANLSLIVNLIPQAVFARDYNGRFVFANKSFTELYGISPKDLVGRTITETIPDKNEPAHILKQDQEIIDTGVTKVIPEMRFVDYSGRERLFYITKVPYLIPGSKERAVLGIGLDITEIREGERQLRQSKENLRMIVDLIPQAIFAVNSDGTLLFANKSFAELYGMNPKDVVYKSLQDLDHDKKTADEALQLARDIISSGKMKIIPEITFTDHTGKERIFYSVRVPYTPAGRHEQTMLGISLDITEEKKSEAERSKIVTDIIQRNKDLEQFSYIVSHNLRAPVANIIGLTKLLQMADHDEDERKQSMSQLSVAVGKLDAIIKDLNYILQIKHQVNEKREIVNLPSLLHDIRDSIKNLMNPEDVTITGDFTEVSELLTLKSYIHSIFFNLISNSIKYRKPDVNPVIRITGRKQGNDISLTFSDNGLGIDLGQKGEQVFGLYKRFHDHVEGKGMGLYMVKTQVETLGGRISIQSEVNKGTTFIITFPIN